MPSSLVRALAFVLVALATIPVAAQTTITLQDGLNGYVGTTDNYSWSGLADDNNGAEVTWSMSTNATTFGMVRFPIFALDGGPVPNNANIVSATLSLHKYSGPDSVFKANRFLKNWNEMQSTWNQAALAMPWQTAGASGAEDILSTQDGQGSIGASAGWVDIDVTSGVQAFRNGTLNYGWRIAYVSGSTSSKTFITRNNTGLPTLRPKLAVTYTLGSPGLPAPQNLDASTSGLTVKLRWSDMSSDETLFKIERKTGQGGTYSQIATVGADITLYTDTAVAVNNTYFYRVRASNGATDGLYSSEAGITLTSSSNDGGWTMDYTYDPFGNLVESKVGSITTTITYDLRGRKTAMSDPDMGNWTYVYNALGELKSQTDAKSQPTTMTYDLLGRMTERREPDLISTWTYDSCTKGVGKLCQASSDNGFNRTYTYDSLGRISQIATGFDATTYNVDYTYDASGRLSTTSYPTGFIAKNVYNTYGYQSQLTDNAGATVYWQANTMTAAGKVLTAAQANSQTTTTYTYDSVDRQLTNVVQSSSGVLQNFRYTWDGVGNLLRREDLHQAVDENFSYDKLNRLDLSSGPNLVTKSFSYDDLGNILYRSDVGTYTYGAKPHAVASVSGTLNASFTYDANGNMEGGNGRTFTYTSYNMPVTITGNGYTYTYTYGPDHERVRLVHSTLGTFIYLNAGAELLYEKQTRLDGLIEHKHYLSAGGTAVGVHLTRSDSSQETRYFHHDHIGSLTLVTDASGGQLDRLAYEAFGKRRNPNGSDDPNNTINPQSTDRGFTMHEHLDEIALIHMNGRIYDPLLARFITPDPFVQAPYNLQSYNRYSYVFNNPLRNYDPSGYWSWRKAWREFREEVKEVVDDVVEVVKDVAHAVEENLPTIVAIGAAIITHGATLWALGGVSVAGASVAAGAAGGFVGGFVGSGGNIEAAIIGGITGGAFGAIGTNLGGTKAVLAKAAVGCVSSAASGGSCTTGAMSAGVSEWAGARLPADPVAQLAGSAIIGGTASKINGGSFANGATTASFAYMFADQFRGTPDSAGRTLNEGERRALENDVPTDVIDRARVIDDKMPAWALPRARAIALGDQIYVRKGQYTIPRLGHELVHVEDYSRGMTYTEYVFEALRVGGVGEGQGNRFEEPAFRLQRKLEARQ